jgi:DNA-3-methyladenine glycosylase II
LAIPAAARGGYARRLPARKHVDDAFLSAPSPARGAVVRARRRANLHDAVTAGFTTLTRARLHDAVRELAARDRHLAGIVRDFGPPPLWARPRGFATVVRIILEQQVSLASAAALFARLERHFDGALTPARVAAQGEPALLALGLTRQKARYVVGLATRIEDGQVSLERIARLSDAAAEQALVQVNGIGPWTAGVYLLMALRRPDVWPPGDLGLHKSLAEVRGLPVVPGSAEAAAFALRWRPWRAVAARLLWHSYLSRRDKAWDRQPRPAAATRVT